MRVGIDCLRIDPAFRGGLNTFTQGLLDGFAEQRNGHTFHVYMSERNQEWFAKLFGQPGFECIVLKHQNRAWQKAACGAGLLLGRLKPYEWINDFAHGRAGKKMHDECDVIYTPTVMLRYFGGRKPTVLSIHDLQHVHYPEFFSYARRLSRKVTYGASARRANYLQASSRYTKSDLLRHFPKLRPERIAVISEGVQRADFATPPVGAETLRQRHGLPERFLFYPAQLWPHKNHLMLLKALRWTQSNSGRKIPLVLTGAPYAAAPAILRFLREKSMNEVQYLGVVSFADLVALYRSAAFLIMPSLHESSSLPVLEAAAAGTPIMASRIPPLEEMAEKLALNLFDPLDEEHMGRMILNSWDNPAIGRMQAQTNFDRVAAYSWGNVAKQYLSLMERAVIG
jgi:glycosyltransferase involved in cell wall biosynthesis